MGNTIKLDKQVVSDALVKIQKMIDVSLDDLAAFEKVSKELLTDQNIAGSKRMKNLAETNDEKAKGRKLCIERAIENLKIAKAALTKFSETMGM
jgi:hypothetical protein